MLRQQQIKTQNRVQEEQLTASALARRFVDKVPLREPDRALAPQGAQYLSPGREPWVRKPSPPSRSAGHPSPARAGEGKGKGSASTHGWCRGLSYVAPS